MSTSVTVEAPSRLHLGMFAFGAGHRRQFGGVGIMVDEPRLRVTIHPAARYSCSGFHAARTTEIARKVSQQWLGAALPTCEIRVEAAPPEHAGLGLGTQLSLAVGVALTRYCNLARLPSAEEISIKLGRARRSSVGTHGFVHGGLIVDAGHAAGEQLGALARRVELPAGWRVVLVVPRQTAGLSGEQESEAFADLPPVPAEITGRLTSELLLEMLPAIHAEDFAAFSRSVYAFGRLAGSCFAPVQGGPFSARAAPIVERLREMGIRGVGQSSWGPTVFALTESQSSAADIRRELAKEPTLSGSDVVISHPNRQGALVR